MSTALLGGIDVDPAWFTNAVHEILDELQAPKSPVDFRGPSGDHMLLQMVGSSTWLLGPDSKRTSAHIALQLARRIQRPVSWHWIELHRLDAVVSKEQIHPNGDRIPCTIELSDWVLSAYGQGDMRDTPTGRCLTIARTIVHDEERAKRPWNYGVDEGESVLGVWRMPTKHPQWPAKMVPPPTPPAPSKRTVLRVRGGRIKRKPSE